MKGKEKRGNKKHEKTVKRNKREKKNVIRPSDELASQDFVRSLPNYFFKVDQKWGNSLRGNTSEFLSWLKGVTFRVIWVL